MLTSLTACSPAKEPQWIVGTWRGQFNGYNVRMNFGEDGAFAMYTQGALVNGTYTLDTSVAPNALDIQVNDAELITTIVEKTGADTFRLEDNLPGQPRPAAFSDYVVFTRDAANALTGTPPYTTPTASAVP